MHLHICLPTYLPTYRQTGLPTRFIGSVKCLDAINKFHLFVIQQNAAHHVNNNDMK